MLLGWLHSLLIDTPIAKLLALVSVPLSDSALPTSTWEMNIADLSMHFFQIQSWNGHLQNPHEERSSCLLSKSEIRTLNTTAIDLVLFDPCDPFGWSPDWNTRIIEATTHKHAGIAVGSYVLIRAQILYLVAHTFNDLNKKDMSWPLQSQLVCLDCPTPHIHGLLMAASRQSVLSRHPQMALAE